MDAKTFLHDFGTIADAPGGVQRLRNLVLELAVTGRLVPHDTDAQAAKRLISKAADIRADLVGRGLVPKPRAFTADDDPPPFPLPSTWAWTDLDSISAYIQRGKSPKYASAPTSTPVVSQKCVQWSGFDLGPARYLVEESLAGYGPERFLQAGDLLWNSTGTGTVGRVIAIPDGLPVDRLVADSHVTVIRLANSHPQFVRAWLASAFVQSRLEELTSGTTQQKELNTSTVRGLGIPLPPRPEQERIVAEVEELMRLCDDLEAHQERRHRSIAHFRSSALHSLTEAETPEDLHLAWERAAASWPTLTCRANGVSSVRQAILELAVGGRLTGERAPEGHTVRLGDVASLQNGYAFKSEWYTKAGVSLVRCQNIGHGNLRWTDRRAITPTRAAEFERFELQLDDIVLALDRPLISTGLKVARVQERDLPALLLQRVARVNPVPAELDAEYLWLWLHSPAFIGSIDPGRSNGVPHISTKEVAAIETWLPSIEAQRITVQRAQHLLQICERLADSLERCERSQTKLSASATASLRIVN
jgi:type I restriction enzyme S subunit